MCWLGAWIYKKIPEYFLKNVPTVDREEILKQLLEKRSKKKVLEILFTAITEQAKLLPKQFKKSFRMKKSKKKLPKQFWIGMYIDINEGFFRPIIKNFFHNNCLRNFQRNFRVKIFITFPQKFTDKLWKEMPGCFGNI